MDLLVLTINAPDYSGAFTREHRTVVIASIAAVPYPVNFDNYLTMPLLAPSLNSAVLSAALSFVVSPAIMDLPMFSAGVQ